MPKLSKNPCKKSVPKKGGKSGKNMFFGRPAPRETLVRVIKFEGSPDRLAAIGSNQVLELPDGEIARLRESGLFR